MTQFWIGLRLIKRQGISGFLSIIGLTLGFVVAIYALLFAWAETHYDQHLPDVERLYLINVLITEPGKEPRMLSRSPGPLAEKMLELPEVEAVTRVRRQYSSVTLGDRFDFNEITAAVDPSFIDFMNLEMLSGTAEALDNPNAVFLSRDMATRLYGSVNAVGETITISGNGPGDYQIAGIFENWPEESHTDFDILTPMNAPSNRAREGMDTNWRGIRAFSYIRLAKGADPAVVERKLDQIFFENSIPSFQLEEGFTYRDYAKPSLQSLDDLHLNGVNYGFTFKPPADLFKLRVLSSIALLIVLIGCVNYINLATVRAMRRSREVAVRKILGASRAHLIRQFLIEVSVVAGVAFLLALVMVEFSIEPVSALIGATLNSNLLTQPGFAVWLAALFTLVVLMAGFYPAYLASAYRPHTILSDHSKGGRSSARLRAVLVVFQFAVSISLAVAAAVIWNQISFAKDKDLGFTPENVVIYYGVRRSPDYTIELTRRIDKSISGRPGVLAVAGSGAPPGWEPNTTNLRLETEDPTVKRTMQIVSVDLDYFDVLSVSPIAGRLFSEDFGNDRRPWEVSAAELLADPDYVTPIVINQRAMRDFGFKTPEEAINAKALQVDDLENTTAVEIVGVIKDFHFDSLKEVIEPMIFYPGPSTFYVIMVKLDPNQPQVGLQSADAGWREAISQSVSRDYLDVALAADYEEDESQLATVSVLATIGIFVAVLGQYGLASHAAQSRRKEIGVRKVLGARIRDIMQLFLWQFSKPVMVAMLVAWPLAFAAATVWLEGFAYRVPINPLWFVSAGLVALLVAMVTVAGHAYTAAKENPVNALQSN